jgi:hypothetical protein
MVIIPVVRNLVQIGMSLRIIVWDLVTVVVHVFADIVKLKIFHAFY